MTAINHSKIFFSCRGKGTVKIWTWNLPHFQSAWLHLFKIDVYFDTWACLSFLFLHAASWESGIYHMEKPVHPRGTYPGAKAAWPVETCPALEQREVTGGPRGDQFHAEDASPWSGFNGRGQCSPVRPAGGKSWEFNTRSLNSNTIRAPRANGHRHAEECDHFQALTSLPERPRKALGMKQCLNELRFL